MAKSRKSKAGSKTGSTAKKAAAKKSGGGGAAGKAPKAKRMPKAELGKYKALLLKERVAVGGDLSHITGNTLNKSARDASGDLSGYSYHMADMASDDYERDFSLGRATDEQKLLYLIDEAMKRVEEGTYGLCLQCAKAIGKSRLKALPHVELCIECQTKKEKK